MSTGNLLTKEAERKHRESIKRSAAPPYPPTLKQIEIYTYMNKMVLLLLFISTAHSICAQIELRGLPEVTNFNIITRGIFCLDLAVRALAQIR